MGYVKTKRSRSLGVTIQRAERQAQNRRRRFWRSDLQRGSWEDGCEA